MEKPKLIVFASGEKFDPVLKELNEPQKGGSGFEKLVEATKSGVLEAEIVAVVSNHEHGGVHEKADRLGIPFIYFPKPWNAENYQRIVAESGAEWVALSGWLKHVSVHSRVWWKVLLRIFGFNKGLDPRRTFNIHPALLSQLSGRFGGEGMYGHYVHEAEKKALDKEEITEGGLTIHFVTSEYDLGPVIFEFKVPLEKGMTADEIGAVVNKAEHEWQPKITNMVIHGKIRWDGKNPNSLTKPGLFEE